MTRLTYLTAISAVAKSSSPADARDGLAGRQDPLTQLKLFPHWCVSHTSEHHGRRSTRDHPPPGRPCAPGEWRMAAERPFGPRGAA